MITRLRSWLSLATAALALVTAATSAATARTGSDAGAKPALAFTSVDVLPMTAEEPVLRDQTVLVEDGRIAAVGPAAGVTVPANAVRIDGRRKYLMPGLADMHVHLEHFDDPAYLKLFLVNGVTTVRSMDGRPEILDAKRRIEGGTLIGPAIYTAGPVLDGSPPVRDDNVALATPEEGRRAVEQQAAAGYEFIKVYANLAPEVFRAIIRAAAERDMPVVGHVPKAVSLDEFLASGAKSIEHLGDFADAIVAPSSAAGDAPPAFLKRRLGFGADDARMDAIAARVAGSRVWVVPTIIADDRLVAPLSAVEKWARNPEAAAVDRGILNGYWRGVLERAAERVGNDWQWVEQGRANRLALLGAFHRAGVPLLVGTDTPQPFVFPGASVHDELANYVAARFTPAQALAAATREPARFLGQEDAWGTIERGKRADLLLLDANPLADIAATKRIAGVVAGGRWMPSERLRQMREEVERVAAASE